MGARARGIAGCLLAAWGAACSALPLAPRAIPDCPGEIRSSDEIEGDFRFRERAVVTAPDVSFPFELVVQKRGRELVLVGISPVGAKLFSAVQIGVETRVDALPAALLPIAPLNVLRDLHRLRLARSSAPLAERERIVFDNARCGYSIALEPLDAHARP
ncbi:MAG TPA: hypothetical protein VEC18_03290 [Myxococcota bacterium]|nr:hypothetical protein [Myxococcota bacterium]